jgi:V/A-type H+-transporting ATPase subunit E
VNQVEALENAILKRAQQLAAESRQRGEAGRRNILREMSAKLHLREEKETLLAKSLADRSYLRKVQADELKLRSKLDHMRWNLALALFEELKQRMLELRRDEDRYRGLLQEFIHQAAEQLPDGPLEIWFNREDRQRLEPDWAQFTKNLASGNELILAEEPIDTIAGVVIQTPDRRIRIDHSFEGRLERLQGKIQQVLVERLLPPVGNNTPI